MFAHLGCYVSTAERDFPTILVFAADHEVDVGMVGIFVDRGSPGKRISCVAFDALNQLFGKEWQREVLGRLRGDDEAVMSKHRRAVTGEL